MLAVLCALGLLTLLPTYAAGANYYECGLPQMRLALAYLADAPRAICAASIFACAFVAASSATLARMRQRLAGTS